MQSLSYSIFAVLLLNCIVNSSRTRRDVLGESQHNIWQCTVPEKPEEENNTNSKCLNCGMLSQEALRASGTEAIVKKNPWHVWLYMTDNLVSRICGGTLISPDVVLTVATCTEKRSADMFKVTAGKMKHSNKSHEPTEQTRDVREIFIPKMYSSNFGSYSSDISILKLAAPFVLNSAVMPVCIDFGKVNDLYYAPPEGTLGTIVGAGREAEEMSTSKYAYIGKEECMKQSPPTFQRFVTFDKFCAVLVLGSQLGQGYSGEGFIIERNGLHFLLGITSIKPHGTSSIVGFTNVSTHITWIETTLKSLSSSQLK